MCHNAITNKNATIPVWTGFIEMANPVRFSVWVNALNNPPDIPFCNVIHFHGMLGGLDHWKWCQFLVKNGFRVIVPS